MRGVGGVRGVCGRHVRFFAVWQAQTSCCRQAQCAVGGVRSRLETNGEGRAFGVRGEIGPFVGGAGAEVMEFGVEGCFSSEGRYAQYSGQQNCDSEASKSHGTPGDDCCALVCRAVKTSALVGIPPRR
jgi:hypothetical protein